MSEETPQHVDVAFPAYGESLPLDHGFPLYAALSRIVPRLHGAEDWGVHPVLGERANHSTLALTDQSRVILRVPANDLGACVVLVGADLEVNGHRLRLGSPRLDRLRPAAAIKARIVTIKGFFADEGSLRDGVLRSLARVEGLGQDPERITVEVGRRRVMAIRGKTVVGFAVGLDGLEPQASLRIQQLGLGGRRRMGAGVFVPVGRRG